MEVDSIRGVMDDTSYDSRVMLKMEAFVNPAQKAFLDVIKEANRKSATDIAVTSGDYARISILKKTKVSDVDYRFSHEDVLSVLTLIIPQQWSGVGVEKLIPANFSFSVLSLGHYRVCALGERHGVTMSIRKLPFLVPTVEEIGLPKYVTDCFMNLSNGLFLVTGPTGSGKSTTLASLVNKVNEERDEKVITIEDPIEYVHISQGSHIVQVEVGVHVKSFNEGIYHALRSNPSIIHIGEIRTKEEIEACLNAAESGHLIVSSFHVSDTVGAIERILYHIEDDIRRLLLVSMLRAVVNQRLFVKRDPDTGRHKFYVACELLSIHNNHALKQQIARREFERIRNDLVSMRNPTETTVSFHACLWNLINGKKITSQDVYQHGYYDLHCKLQR